MGAQRVGEAGADQDSSGALSFGLACVASVPGLLAMDVHRAAFGVDVSPSQGERFRDACAGADEQFGERSVMRRAGVEVAVDFGEPELVKLATLARQRRDELAGIAWQQALSAGVAEDAAKRGLGVVDRLG